MLLLAITETVFFLLFWKIIFLCLILGIVIHLSKAPEVNATKTEKFFDLTSKPRRGFIILQYVVFGGIALSSAIIGICVWAGILV